MRRYLLIAALLTATPLLAQEEPGFFSRLFGTDQADSDAEQGGMLETFIEDNLSGEGRTVEITGFAGALSGRATLDSMTISDADGTWLTMTDVVLDWSRGALFRGRLDVTELSAAEILLPRLPVPAATTEAPTPEATGFSLPELPVSIAIDKIAAQRVAIGQPVLGVEALVSVDGALSLEGGEGSARLVLDKLDAPGGIKLDASYSNSSTVLALDLSVQEAQNGIIATLANLPGRPALEFTAKGEAPVNEFAADIRLATDGVQRLAGRIATSQATDGVPGALTTVAEISGDIAPLFLPQYQAFFGPDVALGATVTSFPDGRFALSDMQVTAAALTLTGGVEIGADGLPEKFDLTGEIASADGPVLLPLSGTETRVGRVDLTLGFDASAGDDWTGDFRIAKLVRPGLAAEQLNLTGTGRIVADPAQRVTAALDFEAVALDLGDPAASEALGEAVSGHVNIDWTAGGPVELRGLTVDGETYGLSGEADIAMKENGPEITGKATVSAERLSVFSGLAGRPLGGSVTLEADFGTEPLAGFFDVSAKGTGTNLSIGQPQADGVLAGTARLDVTARRDETGIDVDLRQLASDAADVAGRASLASGGSRVELRGTLADAAVLMPQLGGPVRLDFEADEDADRNWLWAGNATYSQTSVTANGTVSDIYYLPRLTAAGHVEAGDLSEFAALLDRPLAGQVSLDVTASTTLDATSFDAKVTGTGSGLATGLPQADGLLRGGVTLDVSASRDGDAYAATVRELVSDTVNLTGDGVWSPGTSRLRAKGRLADAGLVLPDLSGPVDLDVEADEGAGGLWTWRTNSAYASTRVTADGTLADLDMVPRVSAKGRIEAGDLSELAALVKRPLAGSVALDLEGSASLDASRFDVTAKGQGSGLVTGIPQVDGLLQGDMRVDLSASHEGSDYAVTLRELASDVANLTGEGVLAPGTSRIRAKGGLADAGLILPELSGPVALDVEADEDASRDWAWRTRSSLASATVDATGTLSDPLGTPKVTASGRIEAEDLSDFARLLNRPLTGQLAVEGKGGAAADLSEFNVDVTATGSGLAIGQAEADRLLAGALSAAVNATGTGGEIAVRTLSLVTGLLNVTAEGTLSADGSGLTLDARLADVSPFAAGFSGPATATGRVGQRADGTYTLDLDATGPAGANASASGTVAPDFGTVDLNVTGRAELAFLNRFVAPRAVSGTVGFDLAVNGPPALGSVSGQLSSTGARLIDPSIGVALNDIALNTSLSGGRAQISVAGAIEDGGKLSITGPVTLTPPFPADLSIALSRVVLRDPRLYETTVDGTVTIDGPLAGGARIAGRLALGETNIRIPSSGLGGSGAVPEITHVNEPAAVRTTRARAGLTGSTGGGNGAGPSYPLDITVNAPNRIFIRGRGLESEFGGALRITGTTNNVVPIGAFNLIRGRLDILGQRLSLSEATVTIQGSFLPVVRIRASTQSDEYTISVNVDGPVSNPEITFTSAPELPQEEVLARLIFGRGLETLSPLQAARLALAVRTLAGKGGEGVVGKIRNSAGLADLDVTTDAEGNPAVRAGTYLGENIYTDVTVGSTGETELNLNLDLTPSVTLKGGVTNTGDTSVGIFFERDY